jgi:hypothetical protein
MLSSNEKGRLVLFAALSLTPAAEDRLDPILESFTTRFLISKLGGNLPIGYFFSTITNYGLRIRTLTF